MFTSSNFSEEEKIFSYGSNEFKEIPIGHFNGFYDWLRNFSGNIVGVRYFPFEDADFLFDELSKLKYSKTDKVKGIIDIYFENANCHSINEDISDDQKFGDNRIFKSLKGKLLFVFDITDVEEELKHKNRDVI